MKKTLLAGSISDGLFDALRSRLPSLVRFEGDLSDSGAVWSALADAESLIYAPPLVREENLGKEIGDLLRGGFVLLKTAAENDVTRKVVLLSTLRMFSRLPQNWRVYPHYNSPGWRPRPSTDPEELLPYLAECSARELTRASGSFNAPGGLYLTVLRQGTTPNSDAAANAVCEALRRPFVVGQPCSYRIVHCGEIPGRVPATNRPASEILVPVDPVPTRPVRRVALIGAGGPVLAAAAQEFAPDYALRLSDVRPLAAIRADGKPQSPGAPLPVPPDELPPNGYGLPHDEYTADIADPDAVLAACAGCDAIINGSVLRHELIPAFRVNAQGVYNVCRAAIAHRIQRIVSTGPLQTGLHNEGDYSWDVAIDMPPARPGRDIYGHSKYLGQEIARVFAENYGLSVPNLMYTQFVTPGQKAGWFAPMLVTWADSARALRAALEVAPEQLGSPYEEFHISVTVPHDIYRYDRARRILGWEAQDDVSYLWQEQS